MTGRPAELYTPFLYRGQRKRIFLAHEFFLAKVDWDWLHGYERSIDWDDYEFLRDAVDDPYQRKRIDPHFLACDRWLSAHCPELHDWLVGGNHQYLLRSSGHQTRTELANGGHVLCGFTVAALDIFDDNVAMEIRLRW